MSSENSIVEIRDLKKYYPVRMGLIRSLRTEERLYVKAVDGISFNIPIPRFLQ